MFSVADSVIFIPSATLKRYWCLLTLLRQTQAGQWHPLMVGTPVQPMLVSRWGWTFVRYPGCYFLLLIVFQPRHCFFFVSGKRSNELKKLPCKFQWHVKLKANTCFFFFVFFNSHWCTLRRSLEQMIRVQFVMMHGNCSTPSLSPFENAQRKMKH